MGASAGDERDHYRGRITLFASGSRLLTVKRVAVVVLVLLAGCSGSLVGETPTPEITPAPVPSETITPTPERSLPGVTNGFLTNPGELVTAHRIALSEVGYTRIRVEDARVEGRTEWTLTTRTRVGPDGRRHAVIIPDGPKDPPTVPPNTSRVERYVGESGTWVAIWRDGERQVTPYPQRFAVGQQPLFPVFGSVPLRVERRTTAGDRLQFRLAGSGVRNEDLLATAARGSNPVGPRLVATVTPRGLIQSYRFSYALATPPATETQRRITHSFRVEAVGETTVSVPEWVPRANAST